jgi:NADH-quinone oxidoreductase subunit G
VLEVKLPYDNRPALVAAIEKDATHFANLNDAPVHADASAATWGGVGESGPLDNAPVTNAITDYYLTNPVAHASETMAKCSQELVHGAAKMAAE